MGDRVTPCYTRRFPKAAQSLRYGEATPRTDPGHKNDSILSENDSFFEVETGTADLIPLGINKHGIVVAQSVRKGAPLNPDVPESRQTTISNKNHRRKSNHFETRHSNQLPRQ